MYLSSGNKRGLNGGLFCKWPTTKAQEKYVYCITFWYFVGGVTVFLECIEHTERYPRGVELLKQ